MIKRISILFVLFGFLYACGGENRADEYSAEIKVVDKHLSELEKAKTQFLKIDSSEAIQWFPAYEKALKVISKYYAKDQETPNIDSYFAARITAYKILKDAKGYAQNRRIYLKEADYTQSQLSDLKDEIINGNSSKETIKEYLDLESKGANTIISTINQYTFHLEKIKAAYDTLNPYINSAVDSLLDIYEAEEL